MSKRGVVRKGRYAPVHLVWRKATLPDGTVRLGAFAEDDVGRSHLSDRGYRDGSRVKGEFKEVRNTEQWRMVHVLGGWLAENHELFEGQDSHSAIKLLQAKSGVGCEFERYKMPEPLNYTIVRAVPLSLAFDLMDQGEFRSYWDGGVEARGSGGWLGWMRKRLYPNMPKMTVDEIELMVMGRVIEWA